MANTFFLYKHFWINNDVPHLQKEISISECKNLLKQGGVAIRNTYQFDIPKETSYWYVIKDSFFGMDELSSKVRNMIRKSLKIYDIRRIDVREIKIIGYDIFIAAQKSYAIKCKVMTNEEYIALMDSYEKDESKEFWGVYNKETGEAVAVSINTVKDNCCEYNTLKALPQALHNNTYPYYGLIYEMNRYYLDERKLLYVNDGARTLTEHSNIQPFLENKFRFRKAYCKLQIIYVWWFKLIVKVIYPFRNIVPFLNVKSILRLEEYRRNC